MTREQAKAMLSRPTVSVSQFADIFDLGLSTAYDAISRGEVEVTRIGGSIRVLSLPLWNRLGFSKLEAIAA